MGADWRVMDGVPRVATPLTMRSGRKVRTEPGSAEENRPGVMTRAEAEAHTQSGGGEPRPNPISSGLEKRPEQGTEGVEDENPPRLVGRSNTTVT